MCVGCGRIGHTLGRFKEIDKEIIDPLHPPKPKEVERTDIWEIVSFPKRKTLTARKQSTTTPKEQERQQQKYVRAEFLNTGAPTQPPGDGRKINENINNKNNGKHAKIGNGPETPAPKTNSTAIKSNNVANQKLFTTINEER
ncbi:hypothetical protein KY284_005052 [Solanum tuberosum]|nr:hypothetical protein KY284_005052 [Solanum tuberosum]